MKKCVFSIYDKKAGIYSNPFTSVRKEAALRDFAHITNEEGNDINRCPEDYDLYQLGVFDDETGLFEVFPRVEFLQNAAFLRKFDAL